MGKNSPKMKYFAEMEAGMEYTRNYGLPDCNIDEKDQMVDTCHEHGYLVGEEVEIARDKRRIEEAIKTRELHINEFAEKKLKEPQLMWDMWIDYGKPEDKEAVDKKILEIKESLEMKKIENNNIVTFNSDSASEQVANAINKIKSKAANIILDCDIHIPDDAAKVELLSEEVCKTLHDEYFETIGEERLILSAETINSRAHVVLEYIPVDGDENAEVYVAKYSKFNQGFVANLLIDVNGMTEAILIHIWQVIEKALLTVVKNSKRVSDGISPLEVYRNMYGYIKDLQINGKTTDELKIAEIQGENCMMINSAEGFKNLVANLGWKGSYLTLLRLYKSGYMGEKLLVLDGKREYDIKKRVGINTMHYYCIRIVDRLINDEVA